MSKISIFASGFLMAGVAMTANAASMGPASTVSGYNNAVVDGGYVTSAYYMVLTWGENNPVHFTEDPSPYFIFSEPDKEEVELTTIALGTPDKVSSEPSDYITLSLGYKYTAGVYTIELPAGIIADEDGNLNESQTFTYNLLSYSDLVGGYGKEFTFTPSQSATSYDDNGQIIPSPFYTPQELSDLRISYPGYNMELANQGAKVTAYVDYFNQIDITDKASDMDGQISLNLEEMESGTWTINIQQGFIKAEKDGKFYINAAITLTYIITGDPEPLKGELMFPTANYLTSLSYIEVNFGQPIKLLADAPAVTCTMGEKDYPAVAKVIMDNQKNYRLKIDLGGELIEPGTYKINIPKEVVTNGKYNNEAMSFEFLVMPYIENFEITPTNNTTISVADAEKIMITFPDASSVVAFEENWKDPKVVIKEYGQADVEESLTLDKNISVEGNKIIISMEDIRQLDYVITIPAGIFSISGGYANPEIILNYSIWDGMEEPVVLQAPYEGGTAPADTEILLSWNYQAITSTDTFGAMLQVGNSQIIPVNPEDLKIVSIQGDENENVENNALYINLTNSLNEYLESSPSNRTVSLIIPAGIVENEDGKINPLRIFKFNVYLTVPEPFACEESEEDPGIYYISWGDYVNWASSFGTDVTLTLKNQEGTKFVLNQQSGTVPAPGSFVKTTVKNENGDNNVIAMNLSEMEDGVYLLYVPSGMMRMNINGSYSPDYTNMFEYTTVIVGNGGVSDNFMEEGEYQINNSIFTINWEDNSRIDFTNPLYEVIYTQPYAFGYIFVSDGENDPVEIPAYITKNNSTYSLEADLSLAVEDGKELGEIEIEIPEGLVMNVEGDVNPYQKIIEKSSTIYDVIETSDQLIKVYNLQGVMMIECKNPLDLKKLPKGIYIINGKKQLINY